MKTDFYRNFIRNIQLGKIDKYFPQLSGKTLFGRPFGVLLLADAYYPHIRKDRAYKNIREYTQYHHGEGETICFIPDPEYSHCICIINQSEFNEDLFIIDGDFQNILNGTECISDYNIRNLCISAISDEFPKHHCITRGHHNIYGQLRTELYVEYITTYRTYLICINTNEWQDQSSRTCKEESAAYKHKAFKDFMC